MGDQWKGCQVLIFAPPHMHVLRQNTIRYKMLSQPLFYAYKS